MADRCKCTQNSISLQGDVFRLAERDHGLSLALLSVKADISIHTLRSWRDGTVMPAWALFKLGKLGGIPDYLLAFIAEPFGFTVVTNEAGSDLDRLALIAAKFAYEYANARNSHGPGGVAITPQENAHLVDLAKQMAGVARAA